MSIQFKKNGVLFDSGECSRNLNFLAHAQMIELEIGSRCGGYGECGGDKIRLTVEDLKKVNPPTTEEREHLTDQELSSGVRLACQCFPDEDLMDFVVSV